MNSQILLFIIKLIAGGLVAFMSIALMSKKRETSWSFIVAGFLLSYVAMVHDLLLEVGIITLLPYTLFGISISLLLCAVLPSLCFIIGFILMLCRQ